MPLHDLLEKSKPGFSLIHPIIGLILGPAAFALVMLMRPEAIAAEQWTPFLVAVLAATAATGIIEKGGTSGVMPALIPAFTITLGFMLGIFILVPALPGDWSPTSLAGISEKMTLDPRTESHELADAPDVFGPYLMAGAYAAIAGAVFGAGGAMFIVNLQVLAWAAFIGDIGSRAGGIPSGLDEMGTSAGAAMTYMMPAMMGMLCAGIGARLAMMRFLGGRGKAAGNSLRESGLTLLIALILLLLAGSIELFGGGMLGKLVGK